MDILSHALWSAVGAKALNKTFARNGKSLRLSAWWTGFWGAFPDLLAFAPLGLFVLWNVFVGDATLGNFRNVVPDSYLNPIQYALRNLTGALYPLSHSAVTWAVAFGIVWLILRRPAWELSGWLLHVVLDVFTHPADFYPTPFLWPISEFRFLDGTAWATPAFLTANYLLLFAFLYLLRERRDIKEGFKAMTNTKKIFLGLLAVIAIVGAWTTFNRRAADAPTPISEPTTETMTVQVFFSNTAFDPGMMECNRTYPVTRTIAKTVAVGRAALEALLAGPTDAEKTQGYLTSLNDGVAVNSLAIQNGVARVDFSARLEEGAGGSCRVAAIRSQIANTLKQFSTVNEVVIGVEGRVEDALQP